MANTGTVVSIDQKLRQRNLVGKSPRKNQNKRRSAITGEILSTKQVEQLISAAMCSCRNGIRDAALILIAYQHGLKVSELINLKWEHLDLHEGTILISRLSNGQETVHPLTERELRLLRKIQKKQQSELVFLSLRKSRMSNLQVRNIIKHAGEEAGFSMQIIPSMLAGESRFNLLNAKTGSLLTQH
jgi:integrase